MLILLSNHTTNHTTNQYKVTQLKICPTILLPSFQLFHLVHLEICMSCLGTFQEAIVFHMAKTNPR